MQELTRTCKIADPYQKVIEYVCIYSDCKLSRFLCSKCVLLQNHKHNRQDNSHIVDHIDFCKQLTNNIYQSNQDRKYDMEQSIFSLNEIVMDMQNLLMNVCNIIQQMEQNNTRAKTHLKDIMKQGFKLIDEQSLNDLIDLKDQLNDLEIYIQLENYSIQLMDLAVKVKEWRLQQKFDKQNHIISQEYIQNIKYSVDQLRSERQQVVYSGAISNNLKYIVSGGTDQIDIWDYKTNNLIKSIQVEQRCCSLRFTEDSTLLYAGVYNCLHKFDVNQQFQELYKEIFETEAIYSIYCINNTTILMSTDDGNIILTDVKLKQQLLTIQANNDCRNGLDYNKAIDIIASASDFYSIKLWNAYDGSIIIEKVQAHKADIYQVLFANNTNQLVSFDFDSNIMIWNINYKAYQLEQQSIIQNSGYNLSLVLKQQYIISAGRKFIRVYTLDRQLIRQFDHDIDSDFHFNIIQPDSMKAVLIIGRGEVNVCKFELYS